jgi:hypothetical protein
MAIVTSTYRYKRPPRKRQATPLAGPAVVTRPTGTPKSEPTAVTAPPSANDDRKPDAAQKPAIVTTASGKQAKLDRARRQDDRPEDPNASAVMRAWLEKAKWGRGPAG